MIHSKALSVEFCQIVLPNLVTDVNTHWRFFCAEMRWKVKTWFLWRIWASSWKTRSDSINWTCVVNQYANNCWLIQTNFSNNFWFISSNIYIQVPEREKIGIKIGLSQWADDETLTFSAVWNDDISKASVNFDSFSKLYSCKFATMTFGNESVKAFQRSYSRSGNVALPSASSNVNGTDLCSILENMFQFWVNMCITWLRVWHNAIFVIWRRSVFSSANASVTSNTAVTSLTVRDESSLSS
jgi:hypothetical protein